MQLDWTDGGGNLKGCRRLDLGKLRERLTTGMKEEVQQHLDTVQVLLPCKHRENVPV